MLAACGAHMAVSAMALLFHSHSAGVGIGEMISGYADGYVEVYRSLVDQMGGTLQTRQDLYARIDWLDQNILRPGIPGLAICGILFTAWINLLLARPLLRRVGLPIPDFGSLNRWRAPDVLIWILIGCGLLLLMPVGGLKFIGLNGLLVMLQIYFLQGVGIVSFFFEKMRFPLIIRWVLYIFTLQMLPLVISLGIFDMWLNVRKIESNPGD
jgi:uncharacterized protein YybS (DUF2232 family)